MAQRFAWKQPPTAKELCASFLLATQCVRGTCLGGLSFNKIIVCSFIKDILT